MRNRAPIRVVTFVLDEPDGAGRALLREQVQAEVAASYGEVGRLCPHCGSTEHGRPRVLGRPDVFVSVSYAGPLAVLATAAVPVGVDVEADGPAPEGFADLAAWTRAEAALKLTGEGLRRDPWAALPEGVRWSALDGLPAGYVGSVATWERDGPTAGRAAL